MITYHLVCHNQLSNSIVRHVKSFFQGHLNLTVIPCSALRPILVTLALKGKRKDYVT